MAKRWYVVHVYSGFEKKIAQQIQEQAAQKGLADQIDQVLVPSEEVVELRRGQKINAERKFFPGYVLVKMELSDDAWHLVKDTPKVTWPARKETLVTTGLVVAMAFVAAFFFFIVDQIIGVGVRALFGIAA